MHHNTPLLASIHQRAFASPQAWNEQSFAELLAQPGVMLYQHEECGLLLVRSAADEIEILTMAVLPEHQRTGIATRLIQQALEDVKNTNITSCFLEVDEQNQPAIHCYKKLGFKQISTRKNYYQTEIHPSNALVMRLKIDKH